MRFPTTSQLVSCSNNSSIIDIKTAAQREEMKFRLLKKTFFHNSHFYLMIRAVATIFLFYAKDILAQVVWSAGQLSLREWLVIWSLGCENMANYYGFNRRHYEREIKCASSLAGGQLVDWYRDAIYFLKYNDLKSFFHVCSLVFVFFLLNYMTTRLLGIVSKFSTNFQITKLDHFLTLRNP